MNWTEWPSYYWIIIIVVLVAINFSRLKTFKKVADSKKRYKDPTLTPEKLSDITFLKECVAQEPMLVEMKKQLDIIVQDKIDFIPVYGYRMKSGVLSTTVSNYMFGFHPQHPGFVVVQINQEGMPMDYPFFIDQTNTDSLKFMLDGSLKIKFPDGESIAILIGSFMADGCEDMYLINVTQTEIVMAFKEFLKKNYNV